MKSRSKLKSQIIVFLVVFTAFIALWFTVSSTLLGQTSAEKALADEIEVRNIYAEIRQLSKIEGHKWVADGIRSRRDARRNHLAHQTGRSDWTDEDADAFGEFERQMKSRHEAEKANIVHEWIETLKEKNQCD